MTEPAKKEIVVVYHDNCIDGMACAWALSQKWEYDAHTTVTYLPFAHDKAESSEKNLLTALKPEAEVYFVDVAPGKALLDDMMFPDADGNKKISAIHILDHHKTAADNLRNYAPPAVAGFTSPQLEILIDEKKPSASHMVWQTVLPDRAPPVFLEMVNKMDRGEGLVTEDDFSAAALIDSKSLRSLTEAFNACNELSQQTYDQMVQNGRDIYTDQKSRIEKVGRNVMHVELAVLPGLSPVRVPVVNADVQDFGRSITTYLRDLGREAESGIAFAWFMNGNGTVTVSIRTEGTPDASKVAEYFCQNDGVTGGGHTTSAAMHFPSFERFSEIVNLSAAKKRPDIKTPSGPKFRLN